jgi:Protein of unknown function (DUF1559)
MRNRRLPPLRSPLLTWALSRARRGEVDTKTVVIIILAVVGGMMLLVCAGAAMFIIPAFQQAREAARRAQSSNNLKQIGLALHNYHDVYKQFPPGGIYGEDGTEFISWQTSLLPFVEQAPLYNQIDMNVSWTDPINRPYYSTVVPTYLHASIPDSPVNAQGLAVSHYAGNSQLFLPNGNMGIRDITDGTSNTAMAGEVAAGFKPWADPSNLRDPAAGLGVGPDTFSGPAGQNGTNLLMGDGAVHFFNNNVSPTVLQAIATPNGGERISF